MSVVPEAMLYLFNPFIFKPYGNAMTIGYRVRAVMLLIFLAVATGASAQGGSGGGGGTGPGLGVGQPSQAAGALGTGLAK